MSKETGLTVIIPWADRPELEATLQRNARTFREEAEQVIVSNCSGSSEWLRKILASPTLENVTILEIPCNTFNKSLAINLAAVITYTKKILILDNDIVVARETVEALSRTVTESAFCTIRDVEDTASGRGPGMALEEVAHLFRLTLLSGESIEVETSRHDYTSHTRSGPGLICLLRDSFLAVGGMSSMLSGWGWEDIDLIVRLQIVLRLVRREIGVASHVQADGTEGAGRHAQRVSSQSRNFLHALISYMAGEYQGTIRADEERWLPRSSIRSIGRHRDAAAVLPPACGRL